MSRWKYKLETKLPENPNKDVWNVGVHEQKINLLLKNGHMVRLCRLDIVKEVLSDPLAIYGGWSRPDKEDCFVYVGKPAHDRRGESIELPPPPGMLFVVFILPDGTIDYWNWRPQSESDPNVPQGVKGEKIWP